VSLNCSACHLPINGQAHDDPEHGRLCTPCWKRLVWRPQGGPAVENERESSRRWKREHLGQPGLPRTPRVEVERVPLRLRRFLQDAGIEQGAVARRLGVAKGRMSEWLSGARPVPEAARDELLQAVRDEAAAARGRHYLRVQVLEREIVGPYLLTGDDEA
jgi:hypothetical protein